MKSATVLFLIFASVFAVNIVSIQPDAANSNSETHLSRTQQMSNLQISNYTGSGITADMVRTFVKFINDAYAFYSFDFVSNAHYIQNKLEGTYSSKFQVLIFPENHTANVRIYTISDGEAFIAWTKVNTDQPTWTYIISIILTNTQSAWVHGRYQKGKGVTDPLEQRIHNIINKYETAQKCLCLTNKVAADLEELDGQRWNVVCSSPKGAYGGFSGYIYQKDGIYLQTDEMTNGNCRYLVWVI